MKKSKELFLMLELLIEVPNALPSKKTITVPLKNIVNCGDGVVAVYKQEGVNDYEYRCYVFSHDSQYCEVHSATIDELERLRIHRYKSYASLPKHFKTSVLRKMYY